jgi:hypothetical protein
MAPPAAAKKRHAPDLGTILRYGLLITAISVTLAGGIYASQQFQQFMIRDPRFFLPGPADYGMESPNLELIGVKYASRAQVLRVFDQDYGRSLYLFPLTESPVRANYRTPTRGFREIARRQHRALGVD